MSRKPECNEITAKFIEKLKQIGQYDIIPYRKSPKIYFIDGKKINIRCTTKLDLFYSVNLNVLPKVDYVVYLTTSPKHNPEHFLMFPSKFLEELKDDMYPNNERPEQRVFNIDWDEGCALMLKNHKVLCVTKYGYDLDSKQYPDFKNF